MTDTIPSPENFSAAPQTEPNSGSPNEPRKSFRRRRKRRGQGQQGPNQGQSQGQNQIQAGQNSQQIKGGQSGNPGQNHSRKQKKRFFKKNRNQGQDANQQNPGNGRGPRGNGQQRRGNKQRRPKVFVGPMDHSYRAVNGNYADAPPSTIELQRGMTNVHYDGNGNGNYNGNQANSSGFGQDALESSAQSPVLENAPTRIYCFIDDLFFIAKIQETAKKLGIKVAFVKNEKETVAQMLDLPEDERPALIVFDLNSVNAKPLTLIPKFKAKFKRATSIVGFLSHLQGELKVKALEAGCDTVMPRSAFSQSLPNLLRRYGIEVEIEDDQRHMLEA